MISTGGSSLARIPPDQKQIKSYEDNGFGNLPICMAKTHLSISHDPKLKGAPEGFVFPIAITLGFFLGRWIGGWFGRPVPGQWVGLVWGIATAFYELYKVSQRMSRRDEAELKRLQEGRDSDA